MNEILLDLNKQSLTFIGDSKDNWFIVRDGCWSYKLFQMTCHKAFEKERSILEDIQECPHLCHINSWGKAVRGNTYYRCIKMQWYGNNGADSLLNPTSPVAISANTLSQKNLTNLAKKLLAPFIELEAKGYRHNDIAPENLIQKEDSSFVLIDFGSAVKLEEIKKREIRPSDIQGHKNFCAPEKQDGSITESSDIYSFGIILKMIAARSKSLGIDCSEDYLAIVHKCIEFKPDARYQFFREIEEALNNLHFNVEPQGLANPEKPAPAMAPAKMPPRPRHKQLALKSFAVAAFVAAISFLAMEVYLTYFRTYGDTPTEKEAVLNRSIFTDIKLTVLDIKKASNYEDNR